MVVEEAEKGEERKLIAENIAYEGERGIHA